jgi:transposase InsO family protein
MPFRWISVGPAFILMKAADHFANPTIAPNQLWQTDFTYLKAIGWGWFYLSTVLDDFSRYILLQQPPLPRVSGQPDAGRRLLR